ncbi:OLC1v1003916C1 [Oldenlandia corymbosa var. corymbosa]|uniref:OLC1v1003916C1 n=1 Tax=Oldenlandia corymbosa var. corymbosa TaxID=529605 RepID=A0AAV1DB20_OLDCO|nr:OLC1v1003916C1 [Oldenlandia corymbosa var. corymbosa]
MASRITSFLLKRMNPAGVRALSTKAVPPPRFSWLEQGIKTPIVDQKDSDTCQIHSFVTALELAYQIDFPGQKVVLDRDELIRAEEIFGDKVTSYVQEDGSVRTLKKFANDLSVGKYVVGRGVSVIDGPMKGRRLYPREVLFCSDDDPLRPAHFMVAIQRQPVVITVPGEMAGDVYKRKPRAPTNTTDLHGTTAIGWLQKNRGGFWLQCQDSSGSSVGIEGTYFVHYESAVDKLCLLAPILRPSHFPLLSYRFMIAIVRRV